MNVFASTQFRLPHITDTEIKNAMKNCDNVLSKKLKEDKTKKKRVVDYRGQNSSFQEIKTKTGEIKLIAFDCKVRSDSGHKIPCWHCRERQGNEDNGMPVSMKEEFCNDQIITKVALHGYFCCASCMYTFVLDRTKGDHNESTNYKRILLNAEILYRLSYPDSCSIIPAKPWELLRSNGGTLDYDMWQDNNLKLKKMTGFSYTQAYQSYS